MLADYQKITDLPTDTYWILAVMALRDTTHRWGASEIVQFLNYIGYLREDGTPFTDEFVATTLRSAKQDGLLNPISRARGRNEETIKADPLINRILRQDLLISFPKELEHCSKMMLKAYSSWRGPFYYSYKKIDQTERLFLKKPTTYASNVTKSLDGVVHDPQAGLRRSKPTLQVLCKISGPAQSYLEAAATYLPPYIPNFLQEAPKAVKMGILKTFADRPQLFPSDTHASLWQLAEVNVNAAPALFYKIANFWLPDYPPEISESSKEKLVSHPWSVATIKGEAGAGSDESYRQKPVFPDFGWILRTVDLINKKQEPVQQLASVYLGDPAAPTTIIKRITSPEEVSLSDTLDSINYQNPLDVVLGLLALVWTGATTSLIDLDAIKKITHSPHLAPMPWLRGQIANCLQQLLPPSTSIPWKELADELATTHGFRYLNDLMQPPSPWEKLLSVMEGAPAVTATASAPSTEGDHRLVFIYEPNSNKVICRQQKYGKKGWSSGRAIGWDKFEDLATKEEDKAVVPALRDYYGNPLPTNTRGRGSYYYWDTIARDVDSGYALYLLAGHPRVFEGDKSRVPLVVERGEAQLLVEHDNDGNLNVSFEPAGLQEGYNILRPAPSKINVYHLTEELHNIAKRIPKDGISVPAFAADRLDQILPKVRQQVTVHSTTDWMNEGLTEKPGQTTPCFHLFPLGGTSHRLEVYSKPVEGSAYYFRPGEGLSRSLIATEEEGRAVLVRNLKAEEEAVQHCLADSPELSEVDFSNWEALLTEDQQTLAVLKELMELVKTERATLEYPKGQRLKLANTVDDEQLKVVVSSGRDWFRVEAGLELDENRVVDYELILEGLRNEDRFIKVGENEFLTLSDQLRERLKKMDGLLHENRGHHELPALAGEAFAEALEGLQEVEFDAAWTANLDRIATAKAFVPPAPPGEFTADLRAYQVVGYEWLLRLANWGVGACLADDMGLGKTIQALAVLTQRAAGGPALVIAPASVIRNWQTETKRFAPTLQPKLIGSAAESEAILDSLGANDVALLSFGLLTYISEALLNRSYHTLVVDEAQAIKNATTQRARAVRDLQADFKIATTGTPIENNLGELWSLFRFLNPGLFGSYQRFRKQYELPITKYENKERAEQLRRVVRPFILRRRKDEVLKELPPKTEIVRTVTPNADERSHYEALRRKALREIEAADQKKRRFLVLQQLTKLRQAACHPKLVRASSKIPSSKLEAVGETIHEIISGGHKALIFSQFVGHLKLVEQWVKAEKIAYQYLDGSTPGKVRQQRVTAFQAGEGELFLISLKAGGTGLNLTAADYVLHLDPWWNPAAEDQASDRAHRIGQKRAVTVYRFVSAGTIEEQIIELHASKRDLADKLLAGTDAAGKLSVDEVVELLRAD